MSNKQKNPVKDAIKKQLQNLAQQLQDLYGPHLEKNMDLWVNAMYSEDDNQLFVEFGDFEHNDEASNIDWYKIHADKEITAPFVLLGDSDGYFSINITKGDVTIQFEAERLSCPLCYRLSNNSLSFDYDDYIQFVACDDDDEYDEDYDDY